MLIAIYPRETERYSSCVVQKFCCTVPERFLAVSRQNKRGKVKCWMENKPLVLLRVPRSTQRLAGEMISGPNLATRARLLPLIVHNPGLFLASLLDMTP